MEIIGKIFQLGENLAGTSKDGKEWIKKTVVIETTDTIQKKVAFTAFGEQRVGDCVYTIQDGQVRYFQVGDLVKISFAPNSREHEGRWFTELSLFSMKLM